MTFKKLNIEEPILKALYEKGYEKPTVIQEKTIPIALNNKDILGLAQTNTAITFLLQRRKTIAKRHSKADRKKITIAN